MKSILFYNATLSNTGNKYGGTQHMLFERAKEISALHPDATIVLAGENVEDTTNWSERIILTRLPLKEDRQEFINIFDTVIFYSDMEGFKNVTKPPQQRWILDLHYWNILEREQLRVNEFDLICTRSELHQRHIQEAINFAVPVHYVYNDLDPTLFKPNPAIQRKPLSLVYAGALVPQKGIDIALQAFVLVKEIFPAVTLDVYGSASMWSHGPHYESELKKNMGELVSFHGAVERHQLVDIFSQHSMLIVPSPLESFSLISIEAQACGCIPIIHNSGGVAVTLSDRKTGFLYTPNNYVKTAETIIAALPIVDSMRDSAQEFVTKKFDKKQHSVRYANLILQRGEFEHPSIPNH